MNKPLVTTLALIVVMFCAIAAQAQPGRAQQEPTPPVRVGPTSTETPAAGVVTDSVYRNDYFGLRITIPQGWTVQGDDVKQSVKETAKKVIVPKSDLNKVELEAAVERTLNLLTISKFPVGEPGQLNALVMVVAEPVPLAANLTDYMKNLKSALQQTRVPVTLIGDGDETINGVRFATVTAVLNPGQSTIRQKYYVILKKGYALGMIASVISESDTDLVNSIVKSVMIQ